MAKYKIEILDYFEFNLLNLLGNVNQKDNEKNKDFIGIRCCFVIFK